jgi:fructose-specific component phosphotransferase system IIB-like protein
MAYTITKTDGTTLGTIADGTINTSATSLTLIGRNYSNYGQAMTDNLVSLLENFSDTAEPTNPLEGQLYWNKSDKRLRIYNGSTFKIIAKLQSAITAPTTITAGDMWWDSVEEQLHVYNGSNPYASTGWILISPLYKKSKGKSGAIPEQLTDSGLQTQDVVSLYHNGTRTAIISANTFAPNVAISGFTVVNAGLTSNSTLNSGQYFIVANDSNQLGGILATNYLRSDINDLTTGNLTIQNNGGLTLGLTSNLSVTTDSAGSATVSTTKDGGTLIFQNTKTIGGSPFTTLTLSADDAVGITSSRKLTISDATVSTNATTGALVVTGGVGITGDTHITGNVTSSTWFVGDITGTSDMVRSIVPITLGGHGADNITEAQQNLLLEPNVNVQAFNVELRAITLVGANGLLTRTASGAATAREIVSADANIAVTMGDGISGNPTLTLNKDAAFDQPTCLTQPENTSDKTIATTEFVINQIPEVTSNIWWAGAPSTGLATHAAALYGTILVSRVRRSRVIGGGNGSYVQYYWQTGGYIKIDSNSNSWVSF